MRSWRLHWGLELQLACGPDSHLLPPQDRLSTAHSSDSTGAQQVCSTGLCPGVCAGLYLSISFMSLSEHTIANIKNTTTHPEKERKSFSLPFSTEAPHFYFVLIPENWSLTMLKGIFIQWETETQRCSVLPTSLLQ